MRTMRTKTLLTAWLNSVGADVRRLILLFRKGSIGKESQPRYLGCYDVKIVFKHFLIVTLLAGATLAPAVEIVTQPPTVGTPREPSVFDFHTPTVCHLLSSACESA